MAGWTVQKLIDDRMAIAVYCQRSACGHHSTLALALLKKRLGPDAPAMPDDLVLKLRCKKCVGKQVGLIYGPLGNKDRRPRG